MNSEEYIRDISEEEKILQKSSEGRIRGAGFFKWTTSVLK
jgi:hypothetical protein